MPTQEAHTFLRASVGIWCRPGGICSGGSDSSCQPPSEVHSPVLSLLPSSSLQGVWSTPQDMPQSPVYSSADLPGRPRSCSTTLPDLKAYLCER